MNKKTGKLQAAERKMLMYLIANPDRLITSAELIEQGWKQSMIWETMSCLRKAGVNLETVRTQPNGWKWHRKER